MARRLPRALRAVAAVAAVLSLAACTGLPTSGDVKQGLALGASEEEPDILLLASGPSDGSSPSRIVDDFLEAGITPANNWEIAQRFLTPELAEEWRPSAGVSIDESATSRTFTSSADQEADAETDGSDAGVDVEGADADDADAAEGSVVEVEVKIELVAAVDEAGAYSEETGTTTLAFSVRKTEGQWRISEAPDGVVIDESRFGRVYEDYSLQYFDQTWTRLVPDVRWLPRRTTIATALTQSLVAGVPSPWLESAVQSAFPADVRLARDAVPIVDQVAMIALNRAAQNIDDLTLARMRTQVEATFAAAGVRVSEVRFTVDGSPLDAGVVKVVADPNDSGAIVLRGEEFGTIVGGEITPIGGVSDEVLTVASRLRTADVSADGSRAALTLDDGHVYLAGDGSVDPLDSRSGLVAPSLDTSGFTWSVPSGAPGQLSVWDGDGVAYPIADAWPDASEVSAIRVASDGVRIAAVVTIGSERWVVVSAIVRDESGAPTGLGAMEPLGRLDGAARGLVWLGADRLGILMEQDGPRIVVQIVGGTRTIESAPAGAATIAGAQSATGMRLLDLAGVLFARSGSSWRESTTGIALLATRAGH
ncbi:GerMN domain-containing protein [Microbacterium sp. ZW T5_45]|uniref:GerMN domain-containing protein n=1 Tax=Microbacterium sp. ZW T5_45 TaxID=3378080 RepID=UPI0038539ED0